jgi:hypothetical protein
MNKPNFLARVAGRLLSGVINDAVRARLSAVWVENDDTFALASRSWNFTQRDRYDADRETILQESLDAWRLNPLARRIVGLTTQYVVGGGITVGTKHESTHKFITDFWNHRLNRMGVRCYELCDELTRTGNLFLVLSTDASGMSYVRPVPASDINTITARPNDIEQPLSFTPKANADNLNPAPYLAYDEETDGPGPDGSFAPIMLHYTINRPVGGQWGESDLAPILKWLSRYSNWLEDRARLNRFRNSFLFVVHAKFNSEAERAARQTQLATNPPQPGSILVSDESETWEVLSPKLESSDAATDGLGLKKMIASGAGVPLHFLAEPESSTRTTAESAGGPTYRHFEQRQNYFIWIVEDLLKIVVARRSKVDSRISKKSEIDVRGADISARDNVALSMAAQNIINMLGDLRDRMLITDEEYLRLAYRFAGEIVDVEDMLAAAKLEGIPVKASQDPTAVQVGVAGKENGDGPENARIKGAGRGKGPGKVVDPDTGELKDSIANPTQ